jgi:hypothetical protein
MRDWLLIPKAAGRRWNELPVPVISRSTQSPHPSAAAPRLSSVPLTARRGRAFEPSCWHVPLNPNHPSWLIPFPHPQRALSEMRDWLLIPKAAGRRWNELPVPVISRSTQSPHPSAAAPPFISPADGPKGACALNRRPSRLRRSRRPLSRATQPSTQPSTQPRQPRAPPRIFPASIRPRRSRLHPQPQHPPCLAQRRPDPRTHHPPPPIRPRRHRPSSFQCPIQSPTQSRTTQICTGRADPPPAPPAHLVPGGRRDRQPRRFHPHRNSAPERRTAGNLRSLAPIRQAH